MVGHTYYHLWNGSALISDLLVRKAQSHPGWNHILPHWWKNPVLITQAGTTSATLMEDSQPGWNHNQHNDERTMFFPPRSEPHPPHGRKICALTSDLVGTESYTLVRMAPSPWLSYMVTDHAPPLSRRVAIALTSVLLDRMASTYICHGRNLIL